MLRYWNQLLPLFLANVLGMQWDRLITVHEEGMVNDQGDIAYEVSNFSAAP